VGKILLAYDDSDGSKKALIRVTPLLKEKDELVVLYVLPSPFIQGFEGLNNQSSKEKAKEMMKALIENLRGKGIRAVGVVKEGDIAQEIISLGSRLECDLIVVGSKGISKIGTFALGSVADKVARHATRPVLIVR